MDKDVCKVTGFWSQSQNKHLLIFIVIVDLFKYDLKLWSAQNVWPQTYEWSLLTDWCFINSCNDSSLLKKYKLS